MTALAQTELDLGFRLVPISMMHPVVVERFQAFCKRYDIPAETRPIGIDWFGMVHAEKVVLVMGIVKRPDGSIEVSDFYPEPSRAGMAAALEVGGMLKAAVDQQAVPYVVGVVMSKNRFMRKHFRDFFGTEARCEVYVYGGNG